MQTVTQYDVFVVLGHVDGNVLHEFIPDWVRMKLSQQPCDVVLEAPDSFNVVVRSVQDWIIATRGSEFSKCRPEDTDTLKRIVGQVKRNALILPTKKIKPPVYKLVFDVASPKHFGVIIGKHGRKIKMLRQRYGFFYVRIDELRVTIQAPCSQNLVFIKSSMQNAIQTHLQNKTDFVQKMMDEKKFPRLECLHIDIVEQTDQEKEYRTRQIIKKKMMDCKQITRVQHAFFRKRAKGKLQKLTL